MPHRMPYRYLRAFAAYAGTAGEALDELLDMAHRQAAPIDVYARTPEGAWVTMQQLHELAAEGSTNAAYLYAKIREYAGDDLPPDPTPEAKKILRAH